MSAPLPTSLLWYDYETTGTDPAVDRPLQFAAQRTTLELEPDESPINLFCRLSPDVLPQPEASLLTGITPQQVEHDGLIEAEFAREVQAVLARPGTCSVGYNSVRFDDEVNRYLFYRNFFDSYAHAWANGTSRWDIVDLARACYALRPEGIHWPRHEDGRPSFKLEHLASANQLDQARAHDARSDVTATIALARLIRTRQRKLYEWHFEARDKAVIAARVAPALRSMDALVHVSSRYPSERGGLALVVPLAELPGRKSGTAWIVADLGVNPAGWMNLPPADLRERLYTRREDLPEELVRPPLKTIQANRVPFVAPRGVLRPEDAERLGLDVDAALVNLEALRACDGVCERVRAAHAVDEAQRASFPDPELALYGAFLDDADRRACERVRGMTPAALACADIRFRDARLPELLFRYRARNWPECLSATEVERWHEYVRGRLNGAAGDRVQTLAQYRGVIAHLRTTTPAGPQQVLLDKLQAWGEALAARVGA